MRRFVTLCLAAVLGCQADALGPPMNASVSALATTMHISEATGRSFFTTVNVSPSSGWGAEVWLTVVDDQGQPVPEAFVTSQWVIGNKVVARPCIGPNVESAGTTSEGFCIANAGQKINHNIPSVTWTVTGITHATLTYDASANVVSTITIQKPVAP